MDFALQVVIGLKVLHIFIVCEIKKLFERDSTQNLPEGESSWSKGRNRAVEPFQLLNSFSLPLKPKIFPLTYQNYPMAVVQELDWILKESQECTVASLLFWSLQQVLVSKLLGDSVRIAFYF